MHILLATDGSANGNAGCQLLGSVAPAPGAKVTVLVVSPSLPLPGTDLEAPPGAGTGDGEEVAIAIASQIAQQLRSAGYEAIEFVRHGDPAGEIIETASSQQPDLIVLGLQGAGRLRRLLAASVAAKVAREAPAPVLLTREPASLETAVVASDGSSGSERALSTLMRVPPRLLTRAILLQVNPPGPDTSQIASSFASASSSLRDAGVEVSQQTATGNEVESILRVAAAERATVIVLGASSVLVDGEPLLGTTANGVLNRAPCSILIGR